MYVSEVEGRGGIYAKVVAASTNGDIPIYTIETRAPKFLDAQFEKHRMLSSNSSSSRAMPVTKLRAQVEEDPWVPFSWRKNQPGMQGYEEMEGVDRTIVHDEWLIACKQAMSSATALADQGLHKQTANRLLDPFAFQKKIVTATEWDNFFDLRLAHTTQPEMQELARCMKEAIQEAPLTHLFPAQWHIPYVTDDEKRTLTNSQVLRISAARCARVSYMTHANEAPLVDKDLELAEMLRNDHHMTPFEHQARPMWPLTSRHVPDGYEDGVTHIDTHGQLWSANFRGWIQRRHLLEGL